MENTIENKAKFFAQYWGQRLLNGKSIVPIRRKISKFDYINVKPISSITDEDAIELGKICGLAMNIIGHRDADKVVLYDDSYKLYINFSSYIWKQKNGAIYHQATLKFYDYLRSKGYALPYMGLSVEVLVEYGWVKLL